MLLFNNLLIVVLLVSCCQAHEIIFPGDELPEPISWLTFGDEPANDQCFSDLGCIKTQNGNRAQDPASILTTFYLYNRNQSDKSYVIEYKKTAAYLSKNTSDIKEYAYDLLDILQAPFDTTKRTIVITNGFKSKAENDWQRAIKDTWLKIEDVNVIIVSWIGGNSVGNDFRLRQYQYAVGNTRVVGRQIAVLLHYLAKLKGNVDVPGDELFVKKIHLIGHSLGAHISSFAGKDIGRVGRITGLDPAGPEFNHIDRKQKLDRKDAYFVDIFHSNAGEIVSWQLMRLGHVEPMGHVDYYLNGGTSQPGCGQIQFPCAHKMVSPLYAELLELQQMSEDGDKSMRNGIKRPSLYSFPARDYNSYLDGTSFFSNCPNFSHPINVGQLKYSGFEKCSVPMDLLSPPDEVREIMADYVDFSNDRAENRTYFQSNHKEPGETLLLRMQFRNEPFRLDDVVQLAANLNLTHLTIVDGTWIEKSQLIKGEKLKDNLIWDETGAFNIIRTYVPPTNTTLLSEMFQNNFYRGEPGRDTNIIDTVQLAFPRKIELEAYQIVDKSYIPGRTEKRSVANQLKSIYLRPLRGPNKPLLVSYSSRPNDRPEVIYLSSEKPEQQLPENYIEHPYRLYMDKIIVGPIDD